MDTLHSGSDFHCRGTQPHEWPPHPLGPQVTPSHGHPYLLLPAQALTHHLRLPLHMDTLLIYSGLNSPQPALCRDTLLTLLGL